MSLNAQQEYLLKCLDNSIKIAEVITIMDNPNLSDVEKYYKLRDMIIKEILEQISKNSQGMPK